MANRYRSVVRATLALAGAFTCLGGVPALAFGVRSAARVAATIATLGVVSGTVRAGAPAYGVRIRMTQQAAGAANNVIDTGDLEQLAVEIGPESHAAYGADGTASSTVSARVEMGRIAVDSASSAHSGGGYVWALTNGSGETGWHDTATVTSATLPFGAPVQLRARMITRYEFSPLASEYGASNLGNMSAHCFGSGGAVLFNMFAMQASLAAAPAPLVRETVFSATVGRVIAFEATLSFLDQSNASTTTAPGNPTYHGSASLAFDAPRAVIFRLEALTPGVSYTTASGVRYDSPCPGDANGDLLVDFVDLNAVLSDFGQFGPALAGDLDLDGDCDFIDLNIVLGAFGSAC